MGLLVHGGSCVNFSCRLIIRVYLNAHYIYEINI